MIDEMKIIAEMLSGAGTGAKEAFVWYLGYKLVVYLLGYLALFTLMALGYRIGSNAVQMHSMAREIHRCYGCDVWITKRERMTILQRIRSDVKAHGTIEEGI